MFVCKLTLIWLLLVDHFVPLIATYISHSNLPSAIVSFRLRTIRFGRPTDRSRSASFNFLVVSVLSLFSGARGF